MSALAVRRYSFAAIVFVAAALVVAIFAIWQTFVGYIDSDDVAYAQAASGWVAHVPYLGGSHWGLRHTIVLPMALGFRIFGENEATLVLPSLLYAGLLLGLLGSIAATLGGWRAAAVTIAVAGSVPVFATGASLVSTDLPEAFFIIGSVWAWFRGLGRGRPALMVISGIAAGLAITTRETTVALFLFYFAVFVIGRGAHFRDYLLMATGCIVVCGLDTLYLYLLSDDPLYRIHTAMRGAQNDGPQMETAGEAASGVDRFGAIALPRWLRPLGAMFLNQNFGLLFWFAVPVATWLALRGLPDSRRVSRVLLGLAVMWVLVLGYALAPWLWVIPRYYAVCMVLIVPLGLVLARRVPYRSWLPFSLIGVLLGSNLALDLGATTGAFAGERALVTAARSHGGIVHTDPATARGASWLLAREELDTHVTTDLPREGDLYFWNGRPRRPIPAGWPLTVAPPGWEILEQTASAPRWTAMLLRVSGIERFLPAGLRAKLDPPPVLTNLYRVPHDGTVPLRPDEAGAAPSASTVQQLAPR